MEHLFELQKDWSGQFDEAAVKKRKQYMRGCSPAWYYGHSEALQLCRLMTDRYAYRYAYSFRKELDPVSSVATTPDPRGLLRIAQRRGDSTIDRCARFEALRFFDDARALAEIEREEPMHLVCHDLEEFIELLEDTIFTGASDTFEVYTYHHPHDHYRVHEYTLGVPVEVSEFLEEKKHRFTCRMLKGGGCALLHHRQKDPWHTWFKIQAQVRKKEKKNPFKVCDRRGLQLVVPDVDDAEQLSEQIIDVITTHAGEIVEVKNNISRGGVLDEHNHNSSPFFRAIKFDFLWCDRGFEIQITTIPHYYSSQYALNDENHELYRLKQAINFHFPILFPHALYGIDWSDEKIRNYLWNMKVAQLGWGIIPDQRVDIVSKKENNCMLPIVQR